MNPRNLPRAAALAMLLIFAAAAGLLSCSDSESRVPFGQMATVVINLNLPAEHPTAMNDSIWNKIRRLFATDAVAQTAPATFSQINVRVTGPDMGAVEQQFNPYAQISMSVPAGSFRQIEVTAYVMPGDPSAALSFNGSAVANLPAGETVSVPVVMNLNETKILVPDYTGQRIYILNSLLGVIDSKNGMDIFHLDQNIAPYDMDFDNRGRIYIADHSQNDILRIDNLNGVNLHWLGMSNIVRSIAVDRANNLLYYITDVAELYQNNLEGTAPNLLDSSQMTVMTALDVSPDGTRLYISAYDERTSPVASIIKYNPSGGGTIDDAFPTSDVAFDVLVKGNTVYAAFNNMQNVLSISTDFNPASAVNLSTNPFDAEDNFLGPHKFVAPLNGGLYVIDENENDGNDFIDRMVFFSNISGLDWRTTQTPGPFIFYNAEN